MAMVRKFLDLSTAHLTPRDADYLEGAAAEWEVIARGGGSASITCGRLPFGFFVHASDEPCEDVPDNIRRVMARARELDCDYILFDQDAEPCEGLPLFDAETGQETTWEALQAA